MVVEVGGGGGEESRWDQEYSMGEGSGSPVGGGL